MNLEIRMENINGGFDPVYSKSTMHRALFAALLCNGKTEISNITFCDDVIATLNVLKACNCDIKIFETKIPIDSTNISSPSFAINCNESASTLRMSMIICAFLFEEVEFVVHESLSKRPIDGYGDLLNIEKKDNIIRVSRNVIPTSIKIDGSVSSQYITGLLLVAPVANIQQIEIVSDIVSKGYIDLTIDVLKEFGVNITFAENMLIVSDNYETNNFYVNEIDESSLSFFTVLEKLGANIEPSDCNISTSQPDRVLLDIMDDDVIDIDKCPDLLPILALYCCFKKKKTTITNTYRTTIKESNRLLNTQEQLNELGANIEIVGDSMVIYPVEKFHPNTVSSCFDHRIEMMLAIACYKSKAVTIINAGNNNKSFPEFYNILIDLGATINKID